MAEGERESPRADICSGMEWTSVRKGVNDCDNCRRTVRHDGEQAGSGLQVRRGEGQRQQENPDQVASFGAAGKDTAARFIPRFKKR